MGQSAEAPGTTEARFSGGEEGGAKPDSTRVKPPEHDHGAWREAPGVQNTDIVGEFLGTTQLLKGARG